MIIASHALKTMCCAFARQDALDLRLDDSDTAFHLFAGRDFLP